MSDRFISSVRRRRPRWPFIAAGLVLLVGAGAAGAYFLFFEKPGKLSDPNAEFVTTPTAPPPKKKPKPETFKWPIYGYTPDRTRFLESKIKPPFHVKWRFRKGKGLVEFQPILANGLLYFVRNEGQAYAVNAK